MSIVNSNKRKVAAIFDKPDKCIDCPCMRVLHIGGREPNARCMLYVNKLIAEMEPEGEVSLTKCDIDIPVGPIPEWCPLVPLTVIGPAPDIGGE